MRLPLMRQVVTRQMLAHQTVTLTNQAGCDSLVTTITTLLPSDAVTINATSCDPSQTGTTVCDDTKSIWL